MSQTERLALIGQLQTDPSDEDFWDYVGQQELDRLIQALEEEWG